MALDGLADGRIFVSGGFFKSRQCGLGGRFKAAQSVGRHLPGLGTALVSPAVSTGKTWLSVCGDDPSICASSHARHDCRGLIFARQRFGQTSLRCRCRRAHLAQSKHDGVRIMAVGLPQRRNQGGNAAAAAGPILPSRSAASLIDRESWLASIFARSPAAGAAGGPIWPKI